MYGGLDINSIKEGISSGYLEALVHYTGYTVSVPKMDNGIDFNIREIEKSEENGYIDIGETGITIDVQLKSTSNITIKNDFVSYDLKVKNYNQLIKEKISTPRILILYYFNSNQDNWIEVSDKKSIFNHCAWWVSLKGKEKTLNKSTKTIKIPITQRLTRDSLKSLMIKVRNGDEL